MAISSNQTNTSAFGVGRREGHDSSKFYSRFKTPELSNDTEVVRPQSLLETLEEGRIFHGSSVNMKDLPDKSVALVVTSPPYFVGKEYELALADQQTGHIPNTYVEFLEMLRNVFSECQRVLEPGGRIAVNVANLGRKPYRSLSADVISILQDDVGLLLRGEIIWEKSSASSGSCAWGSFAKASNPVLRDITERVIVASKGQFSRAVKTKDRKRQGLPNESTLSNDEFVEATRDVWKIDAESATKVGHPAPFPIELPRRLIDLYTYKNDIVLDPFAGSGSTVVAAARTGRIGVGYDTESEYVEMSNQRLASELQRKKELQNKEPAIAELTSEDRQEFYQNRAVQEGKKTQDIARNLLEKAGFQIIRENKKEPRKIVEFNFHITDDLNKRSWWVDVPGAFTSSRPGLHRMDAVWKLLGRLMVLHSNANTDQPIDPVLILTPNLPKSGSPGDRALREAGRDRIFDAIELFDPAGLQRLRHYATDPCSEPLPGFW